MTSTPWWFSDRSGGVSTGVYAALNLADHVGDDPRAVAANRERLAAAVGLGIGDLAVMRAAHGRDVGVARSGGVVADVDVLVTDAHDIGLVALAADCATIAMLDPVAGVAAAVHSGWRGVVADAAGAAVTAMCGIGASPDRIIAVLGPAICPGCYEVSAEVRDRVAASAGSAAAQTRDGSPAVDLHSGISEQLGRAGVVTIDRRPECTFESPELFSYRRDGVTGRHGVVVRVGRDDPV